MEVILIQNVPSLGKEGEVVRVKEGYARNFLIPRKMAYQATATNLKRIELVKKKKQENYEKEKVAAQELAEKLNKLSCSVNVEVNDLDKLYGSVTDNEIIKALEVEGYQFDQKQIVLDKPIEELGIFEVGIKIHPEVIAKIRLWVTKK